MNSRSGLARIGRRPLRVVLYTDARELGGAELSLAHLAASLDQQIDLCVLGIRASLVDRLVENRPSASRALVPPPRSGRDWRSLAAHLAALRSYPSDVVHANMASPWSCQYAVAAAGLLRRRVVAVYQLPVPPINRLQRIAKRVTSLAVNRHVGVGEHTSREVEQLLSLPKASVRTIHNGVPDEPVEPTPRALNSFTVGAVGRLEWQKGYDLLLRALVNAAPVTAVLVGDGGERARLERLAIKLGVANRVVWTGWQSNPRSYLPTFDAFVLPSRFEGFPLSVLEAMLAEVPVVATDVGSVSEAVVSGQTGLLVPPENPAALADALDDLLRDADLRRRLGTSGRRLVLGRFTASHMASAFESLYAELVA
jgi:glycosyltransferase involved in cell wall biosynthesis